MTRDEAMEALSSVFGKEASVHKKGWLEAFEKLGILKFEPDRISGDKRCKIVETFYGQQGLSWTDCHNIVDRINAAGFKITRGDYP